MSTQPQAESAPSALIVAGIVSFYIVAAILMVTVNKWVLLTTTIPIFFLFIQLSIAVVLLLLCQAFRLLSLPQWDTSIAKHLAPLVAVNVTGLIFNNLCLQYVDASFYQIARGLVLPITVGLSFGLHQNPPSIRAAACCIGITMGFGVGVLLDTHSTIVPTTGFIGILFGVLSSCTTAFHSIVIKSSLPHVDNSAVQLAWYINLLSTVAIVPLVILFGEVKGVIAMLEDSAELWRFASGGIISGVVGFLICIAGFLSIKVTSPVTHMVSSAARGVVQTLLSVWFFGDVVSRARATSVSLITLASMAYVRVKHTEQQQQEKQRGSSDPERAGARATDSWVASGREGDRALFEQERGEEVPFVESRRKEEEIGEV